MLLNMLTTPEAHSLSPGIRFALGSAIRSAQCTLTDPNAEFSEPLSPPVWHTEGHQPTGFGWLNQESHYVSSTPLAPQATAAKDGLTAASVREHASTVAENVEMSCVAAPASMDVVMAPQGEQAVKFSPAVPEDAAKLAHVQEACAAQPIPSPGFPPQDITAARPPPSPMSQPQAASPVSLQHGITAGQPPPSPLNQPHAAAPASLQKGITAAQPPPSPMIQPQAASPVSLQQGITAAQPPLSPAVQQQVANAAEPPSGPALPPSPASVQQQLTAALLSPSHVSLQQGRISEQLPPTPVSLQQGTSLAKPLLRSPIALPQGVSAAPLPPSPVFQQQKVDVAPALASPASPRQEVSVALQPPSPMFQQQGLSAAEPSRTPVTLQQGVCAAQPPPGPSPLLRQHGTQALGSPMQQENKSSEPTPSPSLGMPPITDGGRPVSPLSVLGVPLASTDCGTGGEATSHNTSHSTAAHVSQLDVHMHASPEPTMQGAVWQMNQDAGMTPAQAPAATLSPQPEITAALQFQDSIATEAAMSAPLSTVTAPDQVGDREQSGAEGHVVSEPVPNQELHLPASAGLAADPGADATAQDSIASKLAAASAAQPPSHPIIEAVAPGVAVEDLTPAGAVPEGTSSLHRPAAAHSIPVCGALAQGIPDAPSTGSISMVPSHFADADESTGPSPVFSASPRSVGAALPLQSSPLPLPLPTEQLPASLPPMSPTVQNAEPARAVATPTHATLGSSGDVSCTPRPEAVAPQATPPGADGTLPCAQCPVMLGMSVLELPPCSELVGARTPHPTPTATDMASVPAPAQAVVSMSALHDVMQRTGMVSKGSPVGAASPANGHCQPPSRSAAANEHPTPSATELLAPAAAPASAMFAIQESPAAAAVSSVSAVVTDERPSGIPSDALGTPTAALRQQSSSLQAPVDSTPGPAIALAEMVPDGAQLQHENVACRAARTGGHCSVCISFYPALSPMCWLLQMAHACFRQGIRATV